MAIFDRIRDTTTTTATLSATTTFTVSGSAPSGFQTFSARFVSSPADSNIPVVIAHQTLNEWQVAWCSYTASNTLRVDTIIASSNSDNGVTFSAGTKDVFVANSSKAIAALREANTFTGNNTFPNTGLKVQDTDASHVLTLASGALTANRTLTLTTGSAADRTLDISAANVTISTAGAALIDDADAAAQRTTLGLAIGTNVQAYDADLAALAGLSTNGMIARTGAGTAAVRTITAGSNISVANGDGVSGNPTVALANMAANTIKGNATGGLAAPTDLAASDVIGVINTASTGTLNVARGGTGATTLTGVVKGTGTSALTASAIVTADIDDDQVTYAKIQNVSATDRLLGRSTAGAGDVEEITCTAAGRALLDDATTLAQQGTLGFFDTVAAVNAATIDSSVNHIRTAGYYANGDGGGGLYKKVAGTPTSGAGTKYIESSGGQRWELTEAIPNVRQFGAYGDDTNEPTTTAAFQAAYAYAPNGSTIVIPPGTYNYTTFSDTKFVHWKALGKTNSNVLFELPGLVEQNFGVGSVGRKIVADLKTESGDYASQEFRRTANHTGGTPGNVSSALRVYTTVATDVANYEWGLLSVVDNASTAASGENVAVYGQANKTVSGGTGTWAGVFEAKNATNAGDAAGKPLIGVEVDVFSNGADTNSNRIGIDVVVGKGDPVGSNCVATAAFRATSQSGSTYTNGIDMTAGAFGASAMKLSTGNTHSINFGGSAIGTSPFVYGDTSNNMVLRLGSAGFLVRNSGDTGSSFAVGSGGEVAIGGDVDANTRLSVTTGTLGTTSGATLRAQRLYTSVTGNNSALDVTVRRHTAGSDWAGTNIRLQRDVDGTKMGFIDFGVDGIASNQGLGFGSGSNTLMTLLGGGNLGIGTTAPTNFGAGYRTVEIAGTTGGGIFRSSSNTVAVDLYAEAALGIGVLRTVGAYGFRFATNSVERMVITSTGNVLVTSVGGLGYGTGSGGTVTQTTSRTTGVTLNKTNGAITLVSAAGSTTESTFTVTNSTVAATDTVIVSQKSGTDKYIVNVSAVAAGSFNITFRTFSGTTTEQPVFNFAVIKAVTA